MIDITVPERELFNIHSEAARMTELVKDPVCKMSIERQKAADQVLCQGQRYYFCSHLAQQFAGD